MEKSYAVNFTIACWPGLKKAISEGRILASINKLSSTGTISTRSIPGCITPPTVLIFNCFILPFTGERTKVRLTLSS